MKKLMVLLNLGILCGCSTMKGWSVLETHYDFTYWRNYRDDPLYYSVELKDERTFKVDLDDVHLVKWAMDTPKQEFYILTNGYKLVIAI